MPYHYYSFHYIAGSPANACRVQYADPSWLQRRHRIFHQPLHLNGGALVYLEFWRRHHGHDSKPNAYLLFTGNVSGNADDH